MEDLYKISKENGEFVINNDSILIFDEVMTGFRVAKRR